MESASYPKNGMWPSPFNAEAAPAIAADRRIHFADCTLRDGEQQAGVVLSRVAKVEIAKALDGIGIYEIEAGTVANTEEDRLAIGDICRLDLTAKISVLCRGLEADIETAAKLGVWGVRLSFPASALERKNKLKGISDDDYIARALALTRFARSKGLRVIFSPYDTTRTELPFLLRVVTALAVDQTVDRLRIVDTTGCALPEAIAHIIRSVRSNVSSLPLEIHCHNDFGLACANTLAGVAAGADYVSSTVNGLGERCGNTASEEVIMALEVLYGVHTGIDLKALKRLSERVEDLSGIRLSATKAVVGENAFRHESGMVVAGVLKDPFTAEAYAPEIVGQKRQILIGKKSGLASIVYKVAELGIPLETKHFPALLDAVKSRAVQEKRSLTDAEFDRLARDLISTGSPAA